jgi:hypothetical protein
MNVNVQSIPGYGVDADPSRRPGYPKELPPRPLGAAKGPPPPMHPDVKVFKHGQPARQMPPVFGTAQPPKGLSGALRAYAYRYPDHWTRHWMVKLLADRVDVVEHTVRRSLPVLAGLGALALVGGVTMRARRRAGRGALRA